MKIWVSIFFYFPEKL